MRWIRRVFLVTLILGLGAPLVAQAPRRSRPGSRPQTYGTSAVSYVEIPGIEFQPLDSSYQYSTNGTARYTNSCTNFYCFGAPLHLPAGAKVVYLELDFVDTNAATAVYGGLAQCDYAGQNCSYHPTAGGGPMDCALAGTICSGDTFAGGTGFQPADLTPDGITIDDLDNSYSLVATTFSLDSSNQIGGMIVGYVLQVSPAPGTAHFTDVPTNHPFFQYIEALSRSGITAGCQVSPPKYCPDEPLTRGQMAVFLSLALGLQWP